MSNELMILPDTEVLDTVSKQIQETHKTASAGRTPATQIKRRPDGYDYVEEGYMRKKLNDLYPIWSWELNEIQFLGGEWCWARGTLVILDNGVQRKYGAAASHRITYKRGTPHTPENIIDVGNNIKAANSDAFKVAVNRLCNIADDIYRKQVELPKNLTSNQIEKIQTLLENLNNSALTMKVTKQISNGLINSVNYKSAYQKLLNMISERDKDE